MKKINQIIYVGALLIGSLAHAQLSPTENYVYSKTYLSDPTLSNVRTSETVQYFDGLGRPKQVVNIKASPLGRDVVTPIVYDGFGKQTRDYLPVPQQSTTNGAIYGQNSGLVPLPISDPTSVYPAGEKVYTEKELEKSPLDRILEQRQVGTAWTTKPILFGYLANTATDVRKYITTTDPVEGRTNSKLKVSPNDANSASGYYKANQLYKNSVKDEDGNETIEFKNGQGQTVLVRKVISATDNADTYYIYNEYNQLAFVIPPKASFAIKGLAAGTQIAETDPILTDLCYQYRYDGKNRLVEKKVPGKGWGHMVYDKADKLIMTQDAELRKVGKWLFTKYDTFGRVIYTGIILAAPRASLQNTASNFVVADSRDATGFTKNGIQVYYTNILFNEIQTLLSVNYYDTYPTGSPAATNTFTQSLLTDNATQTITTKGMPLVSYVKNIEDDNWTKNYNYYDSKGRVIESYSINHLGGFTRTESQLDFAGVPQKTITKHQRLSSDTPRIITELFTYDPQNRLLTHTHQVDSNPVEILAQNKYNELSQLESKKVGGASATAPLQQVDYKYNIRGWMTQINNPSTLGSDLFGYKIKYNQVEGLETPNLDYSTLKVLPKFNGNIAEVDWKTSTIPNDNLRRYGYVYDNLNRLVAGFYQKDTNASGKEYFEKIDYDLNGNITILKRSSDLLSGDPNTKLIDNLKYDYLGNRLTKVTEQQQNSTGYPYFAAPNIIGYDDNGNMTDHLDKGINKIIYNNLNLPNNIKIDKGPGVFISTTTYLYKADGSKLKKQYNYQQKNPSGGFDTSESTTEYLDGFQYSLESPLGGLCPKCPKPTLELKFVATAEGYYDFTNNSYIYNYTDQLGNVRLSYKKGVSGLEVIEENNYYPFGLKHEGYNVLAGNSNYQYKYQGQELQETGWYSFKWRNYMPDLGRFFNVDPLSEKYTYQSHYNFSENRVVNARELEGLEAKPINDNTIEWRVKIDNRYGHDYSKTLLQDAADILSQNGVTYKIIEDSKALFTIELAPAKVTEDPITRDPITTNGYTVPDGNTYDGKVVSKNKPRTLAHELGHKAGLPHIFDKESKDDNTKANQNNLMNSGENDKVELRNSSGTDLTSSQSTDMQSHIKIINENRERKEKEQQKPNQTQNGN
jgi:RHS repeat-associated protein